MRTDELGLSRIIADLLDPDAPHGQQTAFLERFLARIGADRIPGVRIRPLDPTEVDVRCERPTDDGGRLDISIELGTGQREPLCIAVENKPYAADGTRQVESYLNFLRSQYPGRFMLIYIRKLKDF